MHFVKRTLLFMSLIALVGASTATYALAAKEITIGGKNYTEQYLLTEISKQLLESKGFKTTVRNGVGSSIARKALETAQVDFYLEYTGTAYTVYCKGKDPVVMNDSAKSYEFVKAFDAPKGIVWLDRAPYNNTYTLMMRREDADKEGIHTISELGKRYNEDRKAFTLAVGTEFWERPDGIKLLMKTYGFRVASSRIKKMDLGITYLALKNKQVDVAMGYSTDGRIPKFNLVNLDDDKNIFPVYNPAPVIRKEVLEKYPEIEGILNSMTAKLTADEMQILNAKVDVDRSSVADTATGWLKANKLIL